MKVLAISDKVDDRIYSLTLKEQFGDVELVLGCGDLPFYYLEYVVSVLSVPVLYVQGNHSPSFELMESGERRTSAGGCLDIDNRILEVEGLLIGGLEGSMWYRPDGRYQYTEAQMRFKAWRMMPRLQLNRLTRGKYLDILITHAPPYGIHDADDLCHTGFKVFRSFIDRYRPRYLIHGHIHIYRSQTPRVTQHGETTVINTYGHQLLEIDL